MISRAWILVVLTCLIGSAAVQGAPANESEALAAFRQGQQLLASDQFVAARRELSRALLSGHLPAAQEKEALKTLSDLAEETIFSPKVYQDDPAALSCTIQQGDSFYSLSRKHGLAIPSELLQKINGPAGASLKIGQAVKLLRGPLCAVVDKSARTLDVYLGSGEDRVFVKRIRVGIGKEDRTPEGLFRVANKAIHPTWRAPASSGKKGLVVEYGQKGYPFGKVGLWIGLEGAEPRTAKCRGYALHSTSDPSSIGKNRSLGCVRVGDSDIKTLFGMFVEGHSQVEIRP